MNIKEILLNGGSVSFNYKEKSKDWVGTSRILSFSGGWGLEPKIILEIPTLKIKGRKEFDFKEIDEAISVFKEITFNKKNLCYKQHESMVNLFNQGFDLDLDDEKDFKTTEKERKKLIKKQETRTQSSYFKNKQ
jgi:hypothetical protein